MTAQQLQQRKQRQSTVPRSRNGISRRLILTATTTTAQRQHITKHATLNLLAPVVAILEDDVKFNQLVVLPKFTKLVGTAGTVHTLDRVNINWTLVVLPSGCEFPFDAIALEDKDGSAAVKGEMVEHKGSIAAHIALQSVLAGGAAVANAVSPVEGAVATGISNEANQSLSEGITKEKQLESVYVHERTPIRVFVLKRFVRGA